MLEQFQMNANILLSLILFQMKELLILFNLIQSYSCPLIGSNPSPSTTFTFYCKLDGYKYPRYQLKAIIKNEEEIVEEYVLYGYKHVKPFTMTDKRIQFDIKTDISEYIIIYNIEHYYLSYLCIVKYNNVNINEVYTMNSPYF